MLPTRVWFLLAPVVSALHGLAAGPADPGAGQSIPTGAASSAAVIEGTVRYLPDPQRPWRFSRYYVQNGKEGSLAEAVVALEGALLARSSPPAQAGDHWMDQLNFQFVPETLAIRAGDRVRITNSDDALHNVMTPDGEKPFNVNVIKGKEFTHLFGRAGGLHEPIRIGCIFHGGMRAWIYVFDHPWFKVTARDGHFRLNHVPAGEYTLGVIHPAGKLRWSRRIEVKPDETTTLQITLSPDHLIGSSPKQ